MVCSLLVNALGLVLPATLRTDYSRMVRAGVLALTRVMAYLTMELLVNPSVTSITSLLDSTSAVMEL